MNLPAFSGRKKSINLLPKDAFETSGIGVILSWALAFGKWAVILTQLVVMGAFLYRFVLDRQVTNLRKEIEQESAVVESYADLETEFNLMQERLKFAKPAIASQKKIVDEVKLIQSITPYDVWYERLNFTDNSIQFTANAGSLSGFSSLIGAVKAEDKFKSVSVSRIENGGSEGGQYRFDATLQLKDAKETKK